MPSSNWICANNSKTNLLRIVYPGGQVELHDRPVTAAAIMHRNPSCYVAYPFVFQQPWAIVAPDTVLMLGQKFYVVPINTVRKLQMLSPNRSLSPSPAREIVTISSSVDEIRNAQSCKEKEEDDGKNFTCCIFRKKRIGKQSKKYKQHSKKESEKPPSSTNLHDSDTQTRKRSKDSTGKGLRGGSPRKTWSCEQWQPSLNSITEE